MTTASVNLQPSALILCGGGSRGAMEVGFYRALTEQGIRLDLILGASIGALNGAYIAGGMPPAELAKLWRDFRRNKALHLNWRWLAHPRREAGLFALDPLRRLLRRTLPATRFEDLAIPLTVVTTDLECGEAAYWRHGDLIEPVIASLSLPGIFPPVAAGGCRHVDGGLANNVPFDKAIELGAQTIYMIECVCAERCPMLPRGLVDLIVRGFSIALDGKYRADLECFQRHARIHAVRPQLAREIGLLDFRHSAELIEAAYRQTLQQLAQANPPQRTPGVDTRPDGLR